MANADDARVWLREFGYPDIADAIDRIMADWRARGVATRRNWWDVLAGTREGRPISVSGTTFPVLVAARERKGYGPVDNAVRRSNSEIVPGPILQARWIEHRRAGD